MTHPHRASLNVPVEQSPVGRCTADEAERRSAELVAVLESVPGIVFISHDMGGEYVTGNRTAYELLRMPPGSNLSISAREEEKLRTFRVLRNGVEIPLEEFPIRQAARGLEVHGYEFDVVFDDGAVTTVFGNAIPIRDEQGRPCGSVGAFIDITEFVSLRRQLESALEEGKRESERVAAMESIAEAGISSLGTHDLLNTLAVRIKEGIKTHSSTIFMLDKETDEFEACSACNIPEVVGFRIKATEGLLAKLATERRTVYIRDAEHDPLIVNPHIKRSGAKSLLGTPLVVRGELIGAVYVDMIEIHEFSPEDVSLFELMSSRAALIISNARLQDELREALETETHFSHTLQKALLPPKPYINSGYSVADRYIPAYTGQEIGGDFYDVFRTEAEKVAIIIGDVSGKGLEAASLAAATRSSIRAFAYELSEAGEALSHANRVLYNQQQSEYGTMLFVTVALAILDSPTGHLCYSAAGHPPPAIYHAADRSVEFLTFGNPPIGVSERFEFAEASCHLEPGDKIVFYTDGLSEARHDSELFDSEGIERVLRECGHLSAEDITDRLLQSALDWADGRLRDDTAIIVVARAEG